MKHFLLATACVIIVSIAHAQHSVPQARLKPNIIAVLMQRQATRGLVYKTTSGIMEERVIAQSTRDTVTGPLSDSVSLGYPANMGSKYDYNTMIYPYNYCYNTTPMLSFKGIFTKPMVMADTYLHWTINPFTLVYGLYEKTFASYDLSKNLVSFRHNYIDSVTVKNTSYANSFNSAGNIVQGNWFADVSGVMDSAFCQFFSYDGSGRLQEDSLFEMHLGAWHKVARSLYTYDGTGNIIQIDGYAQTDTTFDSVLAEQVKYVNTYDASNRLTSVATFEFDNTSLAASGRDTFNYTGSSTFHTSWREYQYDEINHYWAPQFRMTKTLNGMGLPDTILTNGYDSVLNEWLPQMMQIARYDTANNPDTLYEYDYNFTSFPALPNYTTVYYYNLYSNTTGVPDIPVTELRLYPNPAVEMVVIDGLTNPAIVELMDEQGRMIMRQTVSVQGKINVGMLRLGNYVVIVRDMQGRVIGTSRFTKL